MLGAGGTFPHPQYMADMAAMLKKYGILWISDEVITGIGRLGEWFGYQSTPGVAPDLIACGKGLTGCVMPVGAVIASKEIAEPFENARWWSGSTWDGHPLVCAAIVGALEWAFENDILQSVRQKGAHLNARLNDLKDKHNCVGRVAGRGLYQTLDLVGSDGTPIIEEDRFHAFTGDTSSNPNSMIYAECAAHGVYLGGYTPNTVKVGPPFTITSDEIDLAMDALDSALTKVGEKWHK
jgi:taurine--2-oxoglutarate transaminase